MTSSQPLRILLVGDYADDPRLGSSKVSHKLREELTALGHHCDTLFSDAIGARPRGRQTRQLVGPALAYRAIASAIAAHPYDVVDAASAEGLWFGLQRLAGRHRGTVLICRSHGLEHLNYQRMLDDARAGLAVKPWTRRLWYPASRLSQVAAAARVADRLLVLNGGDRRFAVERKWQRSDRVDVVPHGVSNRFLESRPNGQPRGGGFLWCGSWDHVKGTAYLVDAWARLHASGVVAPLTVLGAGVPREQIVAAFPTAVRPSITVLDRMPEEKVIEAYRRHDALVFPSTYEGFGLVVLEQICT